MVENSDFVIQRCRDAALGYAGDRVVNSPGDIAMHGFGFLLARYLGFGRSHALLVTVKIVLPYPAEWIE